MTEAVEKLALILFHGQEMESSFSVFVLLVFGLFRVVALSELTARELHHCPQEV